jgi:hypothetical protein
MKRNVAAFTTAAVLFSSGIALAQTANPSGQDGPRAATPSRPNAHQTSDLPPPAAMPDANSPAASTTGQAPNPSKKMNPEENRAGNPTPATPGE